MTCYVYTYVNEVWGVREKVSRITVSVVWEGGGAGKRLTNNGFWGLGGGQGNRMSRVTVSVVWEGVGAGSRCHV